MTITEHLRHLVNRSTSSRYSISKATGIDQAALARFAAGGEIKGQTIDKLAQHFELELTPKSKRRKV